MNARNLYSTSVITSAALASHHVSALLNDTAAAVHLVAALPDRTTRRYADALIASGALTAHDDVAGLSVFGPSHFQAVRNATIAREYFREGPRRAATLRGLVPDDPESPFDVAVRHLRHACLGSVGALTLPTEGELAALTARLYASGAGIEPHVDVLAVESPSDPVAVALDHQLAVNCFVSTSDEGGELVLYETRSSHFVPDDLLDGPHGFDPEELSATVTIRPATGDIIIFRSERIHAVAPASGPIPRATISFFVGLEGGSVPKNMRIWA